jgi:hypothetical protein
MSNELKNHGRQSWDHDAILQDRSQRRRPFDTSGIDWTPEVDKDDPPYRSWWTVEHDNGNKEDRE